MENCEVAKETNSNMQTEELDTFTEGDSLSIGTSCSSGGEEISENGHRLLLGLRRGSACRQLHPLPTIQQIDNGIGEIKTKNYIKKVESCNKYFYKSKYSGHPHRG